MLLKANGEPLYMAGGTGLPYSKALEKKFTVLDRFDEEVKLFRRCGDVIEVPRNCAIEGGNDLRTHGVPAKFAINFTPKNAEQHRVIEESVALLGKGESHILEAPTGFGKTVVGAVIAARMGVKTLVMIPKEDIKKHWVESFIQFAGVPKSRIGLIQADKCIVKGVDVVIGMVHSCCKPDRYPAWVYREFGLLIPDEVHVMAAETFSEAMWLFPTMLRLGMSATPNRQDGRDFVFHGHIGPVRVRTEAVPLTPKVLVVHSEFKVPNVLWSVQNKDTGRYEKKVIPMPHKHGKIMNICKALASDEKRNELIAKLAHKAYLKGRNIVIFSELRDEHLNAIHEKLVKYGIKVSDIAFYVGGMKEVERDKAVTKRVVLTTYKMTSMATNVPWWDTAIMATPRSDVDQIIGRILREYGGKISAEDEGVKEGKVPVVFDIVDTDSSVLNDYFNKRRNFYRKRKAPVKRITA